MLPEGAEIAGCQLSGVFTQNKIIIHRPGHPMDAGRRTYQRAALHNASLVQTGPSNESRVPRQENPPLRLGYNL